MQRARLLAISCVIAASSLLACGSDSTADPKDGECADYCALVIEHCTNDNNQYSDIGTCLATCAAMPLGEPDARAGNSIQCRTFTAATAELAPATTCTRAGPGGDGTCGMNCESFCALADEICVDDNAQFPNGDCLATCAQYPTTVPYNADQQDGDSFACRLYHLTAAASDPDFHCPHIVLVSPVCHI